MLTTFICNCNIKYYVWYRIKFIRFEAYLIKYCFAFKMNTFHRLALVAYLLVICNVAAMLDHARKYCEISWVTCYGGIISGWMSVRSPLECPTPSYHGLQMMTHWSSEILTQTRQSHNSILIIANIKKSNHLSESDEVEAMRHLFLEGVKMSDIWGATAIWPILPMSTLMSSGIYVLHPDTVQSSNI